jgi:hypothetical protein
MFTSYIGLRECKNNKEHFYPLYKDEDIGVNLYWQTHMIESRVDEDMDTDNEQLKIARLQSIVDIREAIDLWHDNGIKILRNRNNMKLKNN